MADEVLLLKLANHCGLLQVNNVIMQNNLDEANSELKKLQLKLDNEINQKQAILAELNALQALLDINNIGDSNGDYSS